ncbi:hypothetical protein SDRG_09224 [Saprolegnia diclina VS20]|uniref:Aminoglycoside phosphotransferase domain-containing protein n=1 Tax=Saprolegnia diclina (strain VS20) TaxID=1156394 RepID=T0QER5_SAPDV|nr:hypothetical protein SDRG_09224 [Saprolegnia diclina VS20]EQC33241.1 hypothetical protein SDRG_09224 [Saprolegnia diclina VS20]|eukprot:XP_008613364.1 hypothetical protein SDRG_09224 [Saprolegnia diclina VS20]
MNFELEETVRAYVARADVIPGRDHSDAVVSAVRLSGGLVNHVWRVTFASGSTVVLKQFPATVKWNPSLRLPTQRSEVEHCALTCMEAQCKVRDGWSTPYPIFYDREESVVIMSDAGDAHVTLFDLLRHDHGAPPALDFVAAAVAEFVASVHDVVEPMAPAEHMSPILISLHEAARPSLVKALGEEEGAAWYARSLAARNVLQQWIFGDLWPSSVLVDVLGQSVSVVDWECCRLGHVGMDVAQMAANLHLMTLGTPFHNEESKGVLTAFIAATQASRAFDKTFDYAGAFVGHVAMLVVYPHWELPNGADEAIVQAARDAEALFAVVA